MEDYFRNRASVDDPDLLQDRRRNDGRLKSRFEHIFAKYEKDFNGVGDEIDLETGNIVVNNGHLESMRHEVDPGKGASSQLVRAFAHDMEIESEDGEEGSEEDTELEKEGTVGKPIVMDDDEEAENSDSKSSGYTSSGVLTDQEGDDGNNENDENSRASPMEPDELSSDFYQDEASGASRTGKDKPVEETGITTQPHFSYELQGDVSTTSTDTSRDASPAMLLENMPFFKESVRAMQSHSTKEGGPLDQDAIHALGKSIASQLAQFIGQGAKTRNGRAAEPIRDRASPWNYPPLPTDKRHRTPSPPPPALSSSAALFATSPGHGASLWAPQEHPKPRKRRRTKLRSLAMAFDEDDEVDPLQSDSPRPSPRSSPFNSDDLQIDPALQQEEGPSGQRFCTNCGDTETAMFRSGPNGELCNSCGMYYYRYGLLRPSYEPEDSPPMPEPKPGSFSVLIPAGHDMDDDPEIFNIPKTPEAGAGGGYAANTGRRVVAGGARITRFTVDEDESIIKLHEIDDLPWETIGRLVSGRSAAAVQLRYDKALKDQDTQARRRLLGKKVKVKQLPEEPSEVIEIDDDDDLPDIARPIVLTEDLRLLGEMPMRDEPGLMDMELKDVERASRKAHNRNLNDPDHRAFRRFTPDEEQLILRLRNIDKLSWQQIQWHLPNRTALALEKHYRHKLVPKHLQSIDDIDPALLDDEDGSKQLPFTAEEDQLITRMRDEENMSFAEMTDYLDDRSEQSLAVRYRRLIKKIDDRTDNSAIVPRLMGDNNDLPEEPALPGSREVDADLPVATPHKSLHLSASLRPPQTPAAPISPTREPPPPAEVGASAWAATQPASKGPLPFQPARKAPVPIAPAPRWPAPPDPFVSKPIAVGTIMGPKKPKPPKPPTSAAVLQLVAKMSGKSGVQVWPSQVAHSTLVPGYWVAGNLSKKPTGITRSVGGASADKTLVPVSKTPTAATVMPQRPDPLVHSGPFYTPVDDALAPSGMSTVGTSTTLDKKNMVRASERLAKAAAGGSNLDGPNEFSADDDRAIKRWREKDGLCWSDIAERLPGRTQQTVTNRYYDVIIGKQAESKAAMLAARYAPDSLHNTRYTDEESERLLTLKDQGLNWYEMAEQMPGRTATSLQNHYYGSLMGSRRGKIAQAENTASKPSQPSQPRGATPLLRQALTNQHKRASLGHAAPAPDPVQDELAQYGMAPPPGKRALAPAPPLSRTQSPPAPAPPRANVRRTASRTSAANAKPLSKSEAREAMQATRLRKSGPLPPPTAPSPTDPFAPQQSPSPSAPDLTNGSVIDPRMSSNEQSPGPSIDLTALDDPPDPPYMRDATPDLPTMRSPSVEMTTFAYPETPLRGGPYGNPYYRQGTPDAIPGSPVYDTPARGGYQSMPYFVAPTAVMTTPSIEQRRSESPFGGPLQGERQVTAPSHSATLGTPPVRHFAGPAGRQRSSSNARKSTSAAHKKRSTSQRFHSVRKSAQMETDTSAEAPSLLADDEEGVSMQARKNNAPAARPKRRSRRHRHKDLVSEESAEESDSEELPVPSSPPRIKSLRKRRAPTLERDSESDYQVDGEGSRPAKRRTGGRLRRTPSPDNDDDGFEKMLEEQIVVQPRETTPSGGVGSADEQPAVTRKGGQKETTIGAPTPEMTSVKDDQSADSHIEPARPSEQGVAMTQTTRPTTAQAQHPPVPNQQRRTAGTPRSAKGRASTGKSLVGPQFVGQDVGWSEIVTLALKSAHGRALRCAEIIHWIKHSFQHYRKQDINTSIWTTLSTKPHFVMVPLEKPVGRCKTAWRLAEAAERRVSVSNSQTDSPKSSDHIELSDDDDELASDLPVLPSPAAHRVGPQGTPAASTTATGKEIINLVTSDAPVEGPQTRSMQPPSARPRASSVLPHGHPNPHPRRNSEVPHPLLPIPASLVKRSASHRHSDPVKRLQQSPAPRAATPSRSARKGTPARAGTPGARSSRAFTPRFEPLRRFSQHEGQSFRASSVQVEYGRAGSVALPGGRRVLLAHGVSAEEQAEEGGEAVDELA